MKSGSFPKVNFSNFKQKKVKSNYNFLDKTFIGKTNPPLLKEIETIKSYENIFDLNKENFVMDEIEEQRTDKLTFSQLTLDMMNIRSKTKKTPS